MYFLLGFKQFWERVETARIVNQVGDMGTGKTLFSVALSYHARRAGYVRNTAFNFPVTDDIADPPVRKYTMASVDEAGVYFNHRNYSDKKMTAVLADLTSFMRKDGSYLCVPSYSTVDKSLRRGVRIYRILNLLDNFIWVYHWEHGPEDAEERKPKINWFEGSLIFVNPRHFFGSYCTYYKPGKQYTMEFIKQFLTTKFDAELAQTLETQRRTH